METRGITRPMALSALESAADDKDGVAAHDDGDRPDADRGGAGRGRGGGGDDDDGARDGGHDGGDGDGRDERRRRLVAHHRQTLWIYWTIVLLGVWVLLSPFTFDYAIGAVEPSGGRGAWLADAPHTALRVALMRGSDVVTGLLLIVFGWRTLTPGRPISLWICCGLGVWLSVAPLLFWCPSAVAYLNATFVGALLIALTVLVPGMPNMILFMRMGPPTPPGWTYNPSSWPQRWIMIVTGFLGWVVSRYLAAFQLGYVEHAWDPVFGPGTRAVLNSSMSHAWPISDAALGSLAYTLEFLMGYMGGPSRWRTMPWMVALFGVLVIPLGLTHIVLVISQPLVVHHWCTLCLLAAAIMLPMIPLEVDEVVAMAQHLKQARRRGDRGGSLWRVFWLGGRADGCTPDERSPELASLPEQPRAVLRASIWGMSFPSTLLATAALGLGLMAVPSWFGLAITSRAADVAHLGGALVVTIAVISMGEVVRAGRWLCVPLGLALAVLPWTAEGATPGAALVTSVAGALVALLSIPRGRVRERFGAWDRLVL